MNRVLERLRAEGCSLLGALEVLRREHGYSLDEARRLLYAHPAWADLGEKSRRLEPEFFEALLPRGVFRQGVHAPPPSQRARKGPPPR